MRILLVDDEPALRELLRATFEGADVTVDEAESGVEAEARGQRALLQQSYLATVTSLAGALESRDSRTGAHSQRVQRYALELLEALHPGSLEHDPGVQYGFLLHDIGKIAIPDQILQKPGPLSRSEWKRMQTHTVLGEQMLAGVAVLHGGGLHVVRSHHERWDGRGYPDGLRGDEVPLGERVFAVAAAPH